MAGHKIFAERLGAFQLRGLRGGTEQAKSGGAKVIDDAFHQRRFRPDDGQSYIAGLGKIQQAGNIVGLNVNIVDTGFQRRAGIAGGDENGLDFR